MSAATSSAPTTNDEPADCHICGKHATGIGLGFTNPRDKDPRWICAECVPLLEQIRMIRRMDPFELKARSGGLEAAAPLVEEFGPDLSAWDEEQALRFCGAVWDGCARELRRLIRNGDAPF